MLCKLSALASRIGEVWQFDDFGFANNIMQLFELFYALVSCV
ncbi:hypothetical protein HMPREF3230_00144 [Gardnerella vaginalis]|uniref:Uncharacterized protein n=1 Tax=Gardnerella vaginalis TaxID=2702 RepID=A0A135ZBK6_GARVA|nr:hypothetical protein HMPREF3230_00144 [Gardnerella vaginalis]